MSLGKRTVRERSAIDYHQSTAVMAVANAVEYVQKQRGNVLSNEEYAEIELAGIATLYIALLELSGFTDDEDRQKRIMDNARKLATEKLGVDLEVEQI